MTGFRLGCGTKTKGGEKLSPPGGKPTALVDGVTAPQGFGIKSYLHHFYQSPTVEDMDQSAWYLLPPPPSARRGLFLCRICTIIGLLLLVAGACCIVVGYMWPVETFTNRSERILVFEDENGNLYFPTKELHELGQEPMKGWKVAGFCIFSAGAILLALSLLLPTCAQLIGSKRLASFASEDNSPNEPPVRIYPGQPGLGSGPIPVVEEISKVQPGEKETARPTTDDLLAH